MEHVAGLPSSASTRMSPGAITLAVLLHVMAAAVLWWITVNRPVIPPVEEAIEITIEKPKPPDPPPPPPKPEPQAQPKPRPVPPLQGVPPPAEITADRRTQVPPSGDQPKDIAGPPPRPLDEPAPRPQPPAQVAAAEPSKPAEPPPPPPLEQTVPQPPPPAPAVTSLQPPPKEPPPPAAPKPPPPPAVATPHPPPPRPQAPPAVTPHMQPRPAPQIARPQVHPPAIANRDTPPSSSPFVNPADVLNRALASENYIWKNAYKFTFPIDEIGRGYFLRIRVVIARDGRVVSVQVAQSNGTPAMDQAILAAVRRNSPYLPLPPEITGSEAAFDVSLSALGGRY